MILPTEATPIPGSPDSDNRFGREAKLSAGVQHPAIPYMFTLGVFPSRSVERSFRATARRVIRSVRHKWVTGWRCGAH